MADLRQLFHGKLSGIIVLDIIQGRSDYESVFRYGVFGWGGVKLEDAFSCS